MSRKGLTILLVEDDLVMAKDMVELLSEKGYEVLEPVNNCTDALVSFSKYQPDLAIMDIDLNGDEKDGVYIVEQFNRIRHIPIIFLTGLTSKAIRQRVRATRPANYLVKPYNEFELATAIELAIDNFHLQKEPTPEVQQNISVDKQDFYLQEDHFFAKKEHRWVKVRIAEIVWVKADNVYVDIHTTSDKFTCSAKLKSFCEQVPHPDLIRVHRSYVVNRHQIEAFTEGMVYLGKEEPQQRIPVGPSFREAVLGNLQRLRAD